MRSPLKIANRARTLANRDQIITEICKGLSTGEPLASLCRSPDMPSREAIYQWVKEDPALLDRLNAAKDDGADCLAQGCLAIVDDLKEDPASRRIRVETRMKLLSKWFPKRYGDRVEVEQSGTVNMVVSIGGNA